MMRGHAKRAPLGAVSAVLAAGIVAAFYVAKLPAALPELKRELSLSLVAASVAVSAFNTLALLAAPVFGLAADRAGAFRCLLAGLALLVVGALVALPGGDTLLVLSRLVEGAGFLATVIAAPALLVSVAADRRRLALGVWSAYMPTGASLTMIAAPAIMETSGWRGLWLVAVASAATVAIALVALRSRYPSQRPKPQVQGAKASRGGRALFAPHARAGPRWLGLAFAFYTAQFGSVMVWLPTFLVARGASLATATLATAGYVAANIPGNLLGTWLIQRGARRGRLVLRSSLAMAAAAVVAFAPLADVARYGAIVMLSFVGGTIPAAVLSGSALHARAPDEVGAVQGLLVQGANLGQFAGPPAVAAVVAWTGEWSAALAVLLTAAVLGAFAGIRLDRHERAMREAVPK
jgi:cyanate permease